MRTSLSKHVWRGALATLLILFAAGCGQKPEPVDNGAAPVYDLGERLRHAVSEKTWTVLDLGQKGSETFLLDGWAEIRGAPDGTQARWTTRRKAEVRVFIPEPSDLTLTISCDPYTRSYLEQKMSVLLNGHKVFKKSVPRGKGFKEYKIRIPGRFLKYGENVIGLKARYVSTRHKKALRISRLELQGLPDASIETTPATKTNDGWRQQPGTRVGWRIVVPRGGYVQAQPAFDKTTEDSECGIYLRLGDRRVELARFTSSPSEPVKLPLAGFGGKRGLLEFETFGHSPAEWKGTVVAGAIDPRDVNVILFTIDTLRADHVKTYGYKRDTTPNIDRLARKGTVFLNAYANSNESAPSHASILTARYPQSHGLLTNARKLDRQQRTLGHILGKAGYRTACYVNFGILRQGNTTGKGFDNRTAVLYTPAVITLRKSKKNVFAYAYRWTKALWQEKQFTWIHSQYLHMENLPEPYNRMFWESDRTECRADKAGERFFPLLTKQERRQLRIRYNRKKIDLTEEELESAVAFYDGGIRFSDEFVGLFMEGLEKIGLDPFTAIIITSDHGVSIGERHAIRHMGPPYDHLLKVPLIMVLPGSGQIPGGRIDGLVELVDIAPTLLDYLGMNVPRRMQGVSLMSLVQNPDGKAKESVYATVPGPGHNPYYSVRTEEGRYYSNLEDEDFLEVDVTRREVTSVADEHPELVARLKENLHHWIKITPDLSAKTKEDVSDEVKEMLRKAGYLDDSQ